MPLSSNLGLVVEEDGVTVRLEMHGVALKVEVKFHKGHDVLIGPAHPSHVVEQGGLGY